MAPFERLMNRLRGGTSRDDGQAGPDRPVSCAPEALVPAVRRAEQAPPAASVRDAARDAPRGADGDGTGSDGDTRGETGAQAMDLTTTGPGGEHAARENDSPFAELDAAEAARRPSAPAVDVAALEEKVIATLREIYDPEIPVNIYDLGLIYRVDVAESGAVDVEMTLTTPGCPVAATFPGTVESMVANIPEVVDAHVELVWDPPWTMDRMPEEVKLELGLL